MEQSYNDKLIKDSITPAASDAPVRKPRPEKINGIPTDRIEHAIKLGCARARAYFEQQRMRVKK